VIQRFQDTFNPAKDTGEKDVDETATPTPEQTEAAPIEFVRKGSTSMKAPLLWTVDSIPNAYDPYQPAQSKWSIVRDMSLHTLSKRFASVAATQVSSDSGSEHSGSNYASRTSTLRHTDSSLSTASGRTTPRSQNGLSKAATLVELHKVEAPLKDWDSTVLDWVHVLDE
jgi:hypothetical protein